ncbi:hypothetical protein AB0H37_05110 [Actinomadura sp. NPDC023710]|uniref:hypothetical protein n=1 Tax=Actinomadura sp. NPDC023710 TaxID=3158219 RepID=UPI0033DE139F
MVELLWLAYLTAANAFVVLRLLPVTDREKDAEILVLRYQITVLERQLDGARVRFTGPDQVLLVVEPGGAAPVRAGAPTAAVGDAAEILDIHVHQFDRAGRVRSGG